MTKKATVFEFTSYEFPAQGGSASGGEPSEKKAVFHYKTEFESGESLLFTETILLPKVPDNNIPKELSPLLYFPLLPEVSTLPAVSSC